MNQDLGKFVQDYKRNVRNVLGNLVGDKIKHNFLFEMCDFVQRSLGTDLFKYYQLALDEKSLAMGNQNSHMDFDIARHIIGIHRFNVALLDDAERVKLENSPEYRGILAEKAIFQIKLRNYGSYFFREHQVTVGEEFLFYPLAYKLFVLTTKAHEVLERREQNFSIDLLLIDIFGKSLSALSLLEDGMYSSAYAICRGMIENFVRMLVLAKNQNVIPLYQKFVGFEVEKNQSDKEFSDEFLNLFESNKFKTKNRQDFLYFGWVDAIPDYKVKCKAYSFKGLMEYCKQCYENNVRDTIIGIEPLYKRCHSYTHGVISNTAFPILHYQEITTIIAYIIPVCFDYLCKIHNADSNINGFNLIDGVYDDLKEVLLKRNRFTTENFNKYYKLKLH